MGRPKNTIPSKEYRIVLPLDLAARLELELHSEVEGRIPYGKLSEMFATLLRKHFTEEVKA